MLRNSTIEVVKPTDRPPPSEARAVALEGIHSPSVDTLSALPVRSDAPDRAAEVDSLAAAPAPAASLPAAELTSDFALALAPVSPADVDHDSRIDLSLTAFSEPRSQDGSATEGDTDILVAAAIDRLVEQVLRYQPDAPVGAIRKAGDIAYRAHKASVRATGEPYICHPLQVTEILTTLQMDAVTVQAALLHDVVEDTALTIEDVQGEFGEDVAHLVDGVTKLTRTDFEPREMPEGEVRRKEQEARRQAENLRKIFLAMARDVRVMIIKLADRLHNMRTLGVFPPEKQRRVARETLDIFAPLAHRLGIWEVKWELEDLSFKYLMPQEFALVAERVAKTRASREGEVRVSMDELAARLKDAGIDASIQGRPKHLWSIYNKMQTQEIDFAAIYDLIALRIIVNSDAECYQALGVVHDLWQPIAGKFDDYIAKPKGNFYRSLHTKVFGPTEEPMEIQIRTWEMHRTAEYGIAAHWQYKEGGRPDGNFEKKLVTLRQQLFDWQNSARDASQFLQEVSSELFSHQVFAFTPRGDVIDLPAGSTPVDFAFRIHTDMGLHCVGAKINGRIVPLSHPLQNSDIVAIMTRSNATPSLDWLHFVKTGHARNKIKAYFKKLQHEDNVARGREALRAELQKHGLDGVGLLHSSRLQEIAVRLNLSNVDALLEEIGYGRLSLSSVLNRLREQEQPSVPVVNRTTHAAPKLDISVGGASGIAIRRSLCCLPLPEEDVVGYVSRGRGLAIHRRTCPNALAYAQSEPQRLVDLNWDAQPDQFFDAPLVLVTLSRVGMLNEVTNIFSQTHTNISHVKATERQDKMGVIEITAAVTGAPGLEELMRRLQEMRDIMSVQRGPVHHAPTPPRRVAPRAARARK